jgi:DNA-directed RNA polymerase specialized sigma24 family protein
MTVQTPPVDLIGSTNFASLMRAYQNMLYASAVRLPGNDAPAQQFAQEAFLKAHKVRKYPARALLERGP